MTASPHAPEGWPLPWMERFLQTLDERRSVALAAMAAGITRQRAYQARNECDEFAQAWDDVIEGHLDAVKANGLTLAIEGQHDAVLDRTGTQVGTRSTQFPGLIQFFLERGRPEEFGRMDKLDIEAELHHTGGIEVVTPRLAEAARIRREQLEREAAERDAGEEG